MPIGLYVLTIQVCLGGGFNKKIGLYYKNEFVMF
jgi:hypothetical protein